MWELQIYENIHKPLHSDEVFLYFYFLFECFQAQKRPLRRENAADATLQCRICRKNRRQTPKVRLLKIAQLSTPRRRTLHNPPDIQVDSAGGPHAGLAEEEAFVHPGILAVHWGLELGSAAEIHSAGASHFDDPAIADMDAHAVVCTDTVDGFDLSTAIALHLIVGASRQDLAFQARSFESTSGNGNDSTGTLPCISDRKGRVKCYMEAHHIFQFRSLGLASLLGCAEGRLRIGTDKCREE